MHDGTGCDLASNDLQWNFSLLARCFGNFQVPFIVVALDTGTKNCFYVINFFDFSKYFT
jgi:hypothetical protein